MENVYICFKVYNGILWFLFPPGPPESLISAMERRLANFTPLQLTYTMSACFCVRSNLILYKIESVVSITKRGDAIKSGFLTFMKNLIIFSIVQVKRKGF